MNTLKATEIFECYSEIFRLVGWKPKMCCEQHGKMWLIKCNHLIEHSTYCKIKRSDILLTSKTVHPISFLYFCLKSMSKNDQIWALDWLACSDSLTYQWHTLTISQTIFVCQWIWVCESEIGSENGLKQISCFQSVSNISRTLSWHFIMKYCKIRIFPGLIEFL